MVNCGILQRSASSASRGDRVAKVSDRVRRLRKEHALTQEEVARRAGLTLNSYGDIERGHVRDPHLSSLEAIAGALGVPIQALVSEEAAVPLADASGTGQPEEVVRDLAEVAQEVLPLIDDLYEQER